MRVLSLWFIPVFIIVSIMTYTGMKLGQLFPLSKEMIFLLTPLLFLLMLGWQVIYRSSNAAYHKFWFKAYAWVGAIMFGLWATCLMLFLPLDIILGVLGVHWHLLNPVIFGLASAITLIGLLQVLKGPQIIRTKVKFDALPQSLQKLKIIQISDLHVGSMIRRNYVARVVELTNREKPDIIAITGDLADGKVEVLQDEIEPLRQLQAKYGVYFVTGNHDYYSGVDPWLKKVVDLGFIPLVNEAHILKVGEASLMLSGVTDPTGGRFHPSHRSNIAKATLNLEADLKILLAHQPGVYAEAERVGFHLQLSGHTHAGQFFPFTLFVKLAHRYVRGLNRHGKLWVYVNQGTGYWGPPLRFLIPAEITLLELC
jgi:predicted MPP superfamily phosphohydrolase